MYTSRPGGHARGAKTIMSTPTISSTSTNPAILSRRIGSLAFALSPKGLTILGAANGATFTIDEALALLDFARTAGVRQFVNRAWLAQQHAEALTTD